METPDGEKVGWWDLITDEAHPASPEHQAALRAAAADWKADQATGYAVNGASSGDQPVRSPTAAIPAPATDTAQPVAPEAGAPETEPVFVAVAPEPVARPWIDWIDLATNRPGAEAREQALAARDAAPVKTVFARVLGVHTHERALRIGADGEEKVAARIDKAMRKDPRWRVLHAIPVGTRGSDIDHLLVGPGGVFTVNAKHHPGAKIWVGGNTFLVDGHRQPYIRNSRYESERAAKLLTTACGFPVNVEGLIVTVNAEDVVIKTQPDGVHVTWRNNLAKWLLRLGPVLTDDQIVAVYEKARRSTTWRS